MCAVLGTIIWIALLVLIVVSIRALIIKFNEIRANKRKTIKDKQNEERKDEIDV